MRTANIFPVIVKYLSQKSCPSEYELNLEYGYLTTLVNDRKLGRKLFN